MTELASLKPKPAYYGDILIFGGKGPAEIGGWMQTPNLSLSYLLGARYTLEGGIARDRLSEVALPAAHLQRHAVEVRLKEIISTARGIDLDYRWLELLEKDPNAKVPSFEEPSDVHWFHLLVPEAENALKAIHFDALPDSLTQMCIKLANLDKREKTGKPDHTRMRYLRTRKGEAQFPEVQVLPLIEHQNELEAIFSDLVYDERQLEPADQNWGTRLAWEARLSMQELEDFGRQDD